MRILITGGSGFIGTHLIQKLLLAYDQIKIVNIDLVESSIKDNRCTTIISDIKLADFGKELIGKKFDICIHLASLCKEPGYKWEEYFVTNFIGTKNVIQLCSILGITKVLFTSTMMVYKADEVQKTENFLTAPDTAYGISKLLAEHELQLWKHTHNGKLIIIRPAVVFGKNENANFTRLFNSLNRGFFPYVGRKETVKSNIYVKELVNFIIYAMQHKLNNVVFNFAFPENYQIKDIVNTFKQVYNIRAFTPVIPFRLMLGIASLFQLLNSIGLKNAIHYRRIEKLYYSTNIFPQASLNDGYVFHYDLKSSLEDWKKDNETIS